MLPFNRLKNLLFSPEAEWAVIKDEAITNLEIHLKYVVWILLLPLVGYLLSIVRFGSLRLSLRAALLGYLIALITVDASAYVVNRLASSFEATDDVNRALKLIAFGVSPVFVAMLLMFVPVLGTLVWLVGAAYSAYLMYLAIPLLMETPDDKVIPFLVAAFVVFVVIYFLLAIIAELIFEASLLPFRLG